jgi:putative SOS response-associated peptidase YedK
MFDIVKLREKLIDELDVPKSAAEGIIEKAKKLQPEIAASFEKWLESGTIDTIEIEGYTLEKLMHERKMNIVSAYLLLDWLKREPEAAKNAMRTREFANSAAARLKKL